MPALWMWRNVPLFRLIRVPARFNLLAAVVAAVLAAAGAGQVLAWLRKPWAGTATIAALASVAMLDMGIAPEGWELKPLPAAYRALDSHDPDSALIELPLANSVNDCIPLDRTYWQALHRRPTSVGYGSLANFRFHELVLQPNAFPIGAEDFSKIRLESVSAWSTMCGSSTTPGFTSQSIGFDTFCSITRVVPAWPIPTAWPG